MIPIPINPFKPGALPKSERARLRIVRKQREAMVRRIHRAATHDNNNNANATNSAVPGFWVHSNDSLQARLQECSATGPILMLDELGAPLSDELLHHLYTNYTDNTSTSTSNNNDMAIPTTTTTTTTLIVGDQMGYVASDEKCLAACEGVRKVSLGPLSLLTSQCITVSHHYLDVYEAAAAASAASSL
jgi:tRNA pseudouridine-54 N-methylase